MIGAVSKLINFRTQTPVADTDILAEYSTVKCCAVVVYIDV